VLSLVTLFLDNVKKPSVSIKKRHKKMGSKMEMQCNNVIHYTFMSVFVLDPVLTTLRLHFCKTLM